jgi:hypothetical protein
MDALATAEPVNTLARPGIGHNNPPLAESLADELATDKARAAELIEAATESQIASDDDAAKVTSLIGLIRAHEKKLDGDREQRKRPFLESCRIVDATYAAVIRPLSLARAGADGRGGLGAMLTVWQRKREAEAAAERARIEDERRRQEEEAERARRAAEAAKANGSGSLSAELEAIAARERADDLARQAETIRPEPIRTSVGAATMRREIAFEIVDIRKALGWLVKNRGNEITQAARTIIGKHLASLGVDAVERGVEIPGASARIERRAQVR